MVVGFFVELELGLFDWENEDDGMIFKIVINREMNWEFGSI